MDSKWHAGHENNTKWKHETPQCDIGGVLDRSAKRPRGNFP